jgi:hypothetical protein
VTDGGTSPFQLYTLWQQKLDILSFHGLKGISPTHMDISAVAALLTFLILPSFVFFA